MFNVGQFEVTHFSIEGVLLISPKIWGDERGFFTERYRSAEFHEMGIPSMLQENYSRSQSNVLRGLHFQYDQPQSKLVTVTRGQIFDVAVDLRSGSKTFGQHISVELTGDRPQWFYVPAGFAHGFCVTSPEGADVLYKVDQVYNAKGESAIAWDDSDLKINWPLKEPLLSAKDRQSPSFASYRKAPHF